MERRTLISTSAVAVVAAGLGAFAATGFGGEDQPAHERAVNVGKVEFEVAGGGEAARVGEPVARRGRRKPVVTHLISTDPIPAATGTSTFTPAACPRGTGQPIGGGIVGPNAHAAASVLSRFNPNTLQAPRNRYFIGLRNDQGSTVNFRATLICGKGIRVR